MNNKIGMYLFELNYNKLLSYVVKIYLSLIRIIKRAFLKLHCVQEYPALSIGPLKSFFVLGKIQYEGEHARNMAASSNHGSSETTCGAYILKDNLFKCWFIGFLEGKGSFIINQDRSLEFKIVHKSTDASVLFYIKKKLGFGIVRIQDKVKKNHCFKVIDVKGLLNLILLLNGSLFLDSKEKEFKLFIDAYNKKYGTTLVCTPSDKNINKPELSQGNYWLSGFTDAVGSFTCIIKDKPDKSGLVKLSYTLYQKGDFNQIKYLAEILNGKTHYKNGIYEATVNTTKLSKIISYLDIHPLKTNKSIYFFNIRKIYILIKEKKSLTDEDIKLLTKYKKNLNRLA